MYEAGLRWSLRHQRLTLGFTVLTFAASIFLYVIIPKGFVPAQDTGLLIGVTEAAQDVSFEAMTALQQKIAGVISEDPDVAGVISFVGVGADNPTINSGRLYIDIGTPEHRHASAAEIMRRLRDAAAEVHDIQLHLQPVQDIQIETRPTPTQFQYVLQSLDEKELRRWSAKFLEELKKQKNLADVVTDQQEFGQQIFLTVNREAAARFGLNVAAIDQALYDAYGQHQIATIYAPAYQYKVILEVGEPYRNTTEALNSIYLTLADAVQASPLQTASGVSGDFNNPAQSIPLGAFTLLEKKQAPLIITHQGQFPAVAFSFNLPPGVSLGKALDTLHKVEADIGLPKEIDRSLAGSAAEFAFSLQSQPILIAAAIIAVYIVLGICTRATFTHYDSFDTAVRRRRRAACHDAVRHRSRSGVADRHHSSDRHREEERHHDGRFRAGCGAPGGSVARAVDLSGLPAAFPPDHDDHHGRAAGRAAACDRHRYGLGTAPSARHCRGRRAAGVAVSDALCDAGRLSVLRPAGAAFATTAIAGAIADPVLPGRMNRNCPTDRGRLRAPGMNFSAPFIRRPVATMLLTAAVLLLGMIAWYRLPIASLPTVDRPTISVRTSWPGASAQDVASAVTSPLETQLGLISGLKEMASSSISGQSAITMEFGLNKDLTAASGAVQAAINAAAPALPKNFRRRPAM